MLVISVILFFHLVINNSCSKKNGIYNYINNNINVYLNIVNTYKREVDDSLFTIYIPRINLENVVYNINSSKNNIDYNIQILNGSNIDDNFLFLAAHSGRGKASYFNRLIELNKGDIIYINKGSYRLCFVVVELFYIDKDGYFEYSSLSLRNELYLITCSLEYLNKQFVVRAILVS